MSGSQGATGVNFNPLPPAGGWANWQWNGTAWVPYGAPVGNFSNMLRGAASTTGNTATAMTGMGAQGAALRVYVGSAQFFRNDAGTTPIFVTLNDLASTTIVIPAGSGSALVFATPLQLALNTGLTFTPSASVTTCFGNAQGFSGS